MKENKKKKYLKFKINEEIYCPVCKTRQKNYTSKQVIMATRAVGNTRVLCDIWFVCSVCSVIRRMTKKLKGEKK